ncbi:NAD(P)-dependent dehydrogenase (short-subunit alcohol dehydrogenase family) [Mesorhizobium sp. J18]|uniref:SDR family NAD(P)-dependent oxidoreductase n=1 Tax=Mesorhizobium sp. J18 TaxID=935263 RepID=UPI00119C1E18|nr:SDR family oxidoreductase [Mesorhizobium sp. J18]TWG98278.1 NAD(P)-dependent dehydrogenase (short-subunit alcohol dehydrogenase family) [Mesorhizobium sp. J18]
MSDRDFTAVVTGTSSGIGLDLARRMLDRGWHVIGLSRRAPDFTHERFETVPVDLLDEAETAAVAKDIAGRRKVTHIIHNAGLVWPNLLEDVKPEEIDGLTRLHVTSPMILTQALVPGMRERGFGRVVFVTSRASMGVPTRTAYSATKAAVHGMARTWALELGPDGITVNVVAPGPILTDNFWGIVPKGSEREQKIADQLPVRRLGTVEDVSRAVLFFAEPEAGFVTGQVLFVCGGGSLGGLSL